MNERRPSIRQAKPGTKAIKMFDGRGLYLLLSPNGSRGWRCKYRVDGRELLRAIDGYPGNALLATQ